MSLLSARDTFTVTASNKNGSKITNALTFHTVLKNKNVKNLTCCFPVPYNKSMYPKGTQPPTLGTIPLMYLLIFQ